MIARDAALAAYEDARIHVQHLSAARVGGGGRRAPRQAGVEITCEATPHHLTLTDEAVRSLDSRFKMNPPLRSEDDRQALIDGLRSGVIDCIATDHAPHSRRGEGGAVRAGGDGRDRARDRVRRPPHRAGPARGARAGDPGRADERRGGRVRTRAPEPRPGSEANLVLFDLEAEWEAGAEGWESRSENSCFAGRELRGRVLMTVVAGRVAYRQRSFAMGVAAVSGAEARPEAGRSGRDRRPGGLPQGRARASTRSPARRPPWSRAPRRSASRSWSPSSTRRGSGTTVPEVAEHLPEGVDAAREGLLLGRRGRRLRPRAGATRCWSAASRPTSASTRRRSTCSTTGVEVHVARDAVGSRFDENREVGLAQGGARRGGDDERRDGAVRAARARRDRRVQAGAEAGPRVRAEPDAGRSRAAYVLLEDGTRFDGELLRRRRRGHRRGRLQHRDDRLPGGGHRPLLRRPDHHLHLSADRQLRRRGGGDGVRPRPRARR